MFWNAEKDTETMNVSWRYLKVLNEKMFKEIFLISEISSIEIFWIMLL